MFLQHRNKRLIKLLTTEDYWATLVNETKPMEPFKRTLFRLAALLDRISWGVLFVMMVMTMADVLLRKFTNITIIGCGEMTEMMMAVVVFCSLAQCEVDDGHIKIDLIMGRVNPKIQALVDTLTQLFCFILFCLITYSTFRHALEIREWEEVSIDLAIPIYPFIFIAASGSGLLALVLLSKTLTRFSEASALWIQSGQES